MKQKKRGRPVYTEEQKEERKQLKQLFEEYSQEAFNTVVSIMRNSKDNTNRLKACTYILEKVTPEKYVEEQDEIQNIEINLVPVGQPFKYSKENLQEIKAAQEDKFWKG